MVFETYIWGMHILWWFVWVLLLLWIFASPYEIPGQRKKRTSPLEVLKLRFANGQISAEEYQNRKSLLESNTEKISK